MPGPTPAVGRAGWIKGGCSEELNAVIPQWVTDAAPEGAAPGSLLPGGKRLWCAFGTRDKKRQRFPQPAPSLEAQCEDNSTQRVHDSLKAIINHTAGSPE